MRSASRWTAQRIAASGSAARRPERTCSAVARSSPSVGSSSSSTAGRRNSARASARRRDSPPESPEPPSPRRASSPPVGDLTPLLGTRSQACPMPGRTAVLCGLGLHCQRQRSPQSGHGQSEMAPLRRPRALLDKSAGGRGPRFPDTPIPPPSSGGRGPCSGSGPPPGSGPRQPGGRRRGTSAAGQGASRRSSGSFPVPAHVRPPLRRFSPFQFRHSARPEYVDIRRIALRALLPCPASKAWRVRPSGSGENTQKVRRTFCPANRGGSAAQTASCQARGPQAVPGVAHRGAFGPSPIGDRASVQLSGDGGDLPVRRDLGEQVRRPPSPVRSDRWHATAR